MQDNRWWGICKKGRNGCREDIFYELGGTKGDLQEWRKVHIGLTLDIKKSK